MRRFTLLLLAVALAAGRTVQRGGGNLRIIHGTETTIERHNYQVHVFDVNGPFCGGSILGEKWILSAAHCFDYDPDHTNKSVRVGSADFDSGGVVHEVDKVVYWEGFDYTDMKHDVALLHLKDPIQFNERAMPVWLTPRGAAAAPGSYVTVSGWGTTKETSITQHPEKLLMARVRVTHPDVCKAVFMRDSPSFQDTMICAAAYGRDSCTGDSGGPLVTDERVQVGVVSWGSGCAHHGRPGVYADLSHPDIQDFIERTMEEN